jgi:hypothetical protein
MKKTSNFDSILLQSRNDSKDMFKTIQTSIILGQTDQMLTIMAREGRAARKAGAPLRPHMLRFMAHFVLLLRSKKSNVPKADGDYFIKSYVDLLISKQLVRNIASTHRL